MKLTERFSYAVSFAIIAAMIVPLYIVLFPIAVVAVACGYKSDGDGTII